MLDGEPAPETLMQMVKATLKANPNNSVIGFKDNSSAIRSALAFLMHASMLLSYHCRVP